jgi:single-stranded-DNA-specific exonuclease
VKGVDLGAAVIAARQAALLLNGGSRHGGKPPMARRSPPESSWMNASPQLGAAPPVRELGTTQPLRPAPRRRS